MVNGKSIAKCVYDGTMDAQFFNAWVEQFLIHALKPGQVVVMDNIFFPNGRAQNISSLPPAAL
jgi:hypothetical protein